MHCSKSFFTCPLTVPFLYTTPSFMITLLLYRLEKREMWKIRFTGNLLFCQTFYSEIGKLFCAFLELTLTTRQVLRIQKGLMRVSPCLLRLS